MEPGEFEGVAGRTLEESTPWWPPLPSAPEGAPNVVVVLLDDVGYAQFGCYGSDIATPTFDRLAAHGLRYSQLPHDGAVLADARLPADRPQPPLATAWVASSSSRRASPATTRRSRRRTGSSPRSSCATGYATFAVGKWHLAPAGTMVAGRPARPVAARPRLRAVLRLPRRRDRPVPPRSRARQPPDRPAAHAGGGLPPHRGPGRPGHRLTSTTCAPSSPTKPFFLWFAPGACHAPHQVPARVDRQVRGRVRPRLGRVARRGVRTPAGDRGCCPTGTELSERPHWVAGVGLADRRRAPAVRPDDGGVRRLPRAHRRAGRRGCSTSSTSSASSTTRSSW